MELNALSAALTGLLEKRRLSKKTIRQYQSTWNSVDRFLAKTYGNGEYDKSRGAEFLKARYGMDSAIAKPTPYQNYLLRAVRLLDVYLEERKFAVYNWRQREEIKLEEDFHSVYTDYCKYLDSSGLAKITVDGLKAQFRDFLAYIMGHGLKSVRQLKLADCVDYLGRFKDKRPKTIARIAYQLRNFLKFLYPDWIKADLASFLKCKSPTWQSRIPSTFEPGELSSLIEAIDVSTPLGKRNYAIVLLASVLALRAVDIWRLSFSNIDWRKPAVNIVQSKTGKSLNLPMPIEVGDAVIDYIMNGRHNEVECDTIFQSTVPPFEPLGRPSALSKLLAKPLREAGIKTEGRHHGLHALRHTDARMMPDMGTALPVISGILGHSNINSTAVYLKVDGAKLAQCALDPKEFDDDL